MRLICTLVLSSILLTSCARQMDADTYSSSNTVGKVLKGTILSTRPVTIKDNDRLTDNATGILAGGAAGAAGGSTIGKGNGNTAAIVGGAIAGAVIGALVEDQLSTQSGTEYIVQLDPTAIPAAPDNKRRKSISVRGDKAIDADIKESINVAETSTDAISVIQTDDVPLAPGQRVLIIYHDDRPRLVAAQ